MSRCAFLAGNPHVIRRASHTLSVVLQLGVGEAIARADDGLAVPGVSKDPGRHAHVRVEKHLHRRTVRLRTAVLSELGVVREVALTHPARAERRAHFAHECDRASYLHALPPAIWSRILRLSLSPLGRRWQTAGRSGLDYTLRARRRRCGNTRMR
jgi:hypothetical protein